MKTSSLTKIIVTSMLAVAAVAAIALPLRATALDTAKGGATQLIALTQPASAPVAPAAVPATMSCSSCKDKTIAYDASSKGSVKDLRTAAIHGCPSCATAIQTVGFDKAKANVAVHSCSMDTASAACCK